MEQDQITYFRRRLNEIAQEKIQAKAVELFGETGRPEQPTWGQVFAAIKAGEITLKPGTETSTRAYLNPSDVEWPAQEVKKLTLEAYKANVAQYCQSAEDSMMLEAGAQEILTRFRVI